MTSNRDWLMRLAHEAPDELAAWMGAEHEEPTNEIADETNGIHTDAPLVYVDAVKLLREAAGSDVSNLLLINSTSACDVEEAYAKLADMVERDYVSREVFEDLRDEFTWETTFLHRMGKQCGTKDVPSLVAYVDKLEARVEELEAVDRRIAETDSRWEAATRDLERMTAERDEWKAKAEGFTEALEKLGCSVLANGTVFEGSSKVRAGSSSAKRAAAVERLRILDEFGGGSFEYAILGSDKMAWPYMDKRDALIDLLTDESCGQDADQGIRAEAPVRENLHDSSKETQKPRSREADSGNVSDSDGENLHVEQDTREKLEADVRKHYAYSTSTLLYPPSANKTTDMLRSLPIDTVVGWLDRQEAITRAELQAENAPETPDSAEIPRKTGEQDADFPANTDRAESIADLLGQTNNVTDEGLAYLAKWHLPSVISMLRDYEDEKLMRDCDLEMNVLLSTEGLQAKVDELQAELAKRDKGIAELEDELHRSYDAESAKAEELTLRGVRIAELQGQVDKLTAERDGWRMRCGDLLDAAHAMQGVADAWDEEV